MTWRNSEDRYGWLTAGLHWLMLLQLAAVYACIELHEFFPKGSDPREALKHWHFMLGLSVLALVLVRIAARLGSGPAPAITPPTPRWQQSLAASVHGLLYLLMIGMPVLGWFILSAKGDPVPFFGLELPALMGENKPLAKSLKEIHETGGTVGYYLIGLHAVAALYHHYFAHDDTLVRMLPWHAWRRG